ncbi:hypothetical protein [Secundilactobacillus similis]|uniref:Uncharacterized protein n=1 Tax=Secundilactobacillus similis DSM 23365 = JCM 2765 TaxID=1423804 RepID=A0A0R2ENR2_9LACO|nr:hypothetical protein [Secundilactobacillus similis]KRN17784.1 hypothetical protein FD14_GL002506 [Secundilactobacillus similis DSM 23365 = JCM 2765]
MTKDQETFKNYFVNIFEQHDADIIRSISWMTRNVNKMPNTIRVAYHHLTGKECNEVIKEICMLGG